MICSWRCSTGLPRHTAASCSSSAMSAHSCRTATPAQHAAAHRDGDVLGRYRLVPARQRVTVVVAAASLASAVGDGSTAAASADVQDSRKTARAAQQLVAEASKANEAEMSQDTRQGLVLLGAGAIIWAIARREMLLAALARVPLPDLVAGLLTVAGVLRMMPVRARTGAAHLAAILQSVFLLGSVASDIAEVKGDIKQLRNAMQGLSARAAWVPPRHPEKERQPWKRDGGAVGVIHKA